MPKYLANNTNQPETVGILLTNLGTPDAPTTSALRRYLKQFLWDPRVVELPRVLWWLILHFIVLVFRPAKSARAYQSIWSKEGSPLLVISQRQREAVEKVLQAKYGDHIKVALGMRYGNPSIASALTTLQQHNATKIIVLPLYPQYSSATTGSTYDAVSQVMSRWRTVPELHFIDSYYDHDALISALANSVKQSGKLETSDKLIFSYHGMPEHTRRSGDPYYEHCQKTSQLLANKLGLGADQWLMTFQSRFGKAEWIKPYTDKTLMALPSEGVTSIAIMCPGFSADCLETLEEIQEENRDYFLAAGGKEYHYIPALNENDEHIACLSAIIARYL
ncbi:MAG: ferrochelatase [Gammaproteobacteria bacterium]|nr:ferrochelatase [Gammaproteobacteria bacterium]